MEALFDEQGVDMHSDCLRRAGQTLNSEVGDMELVALDYVMDVLSVTIQ